MDQRRKQESEEEVNSSSRKRRSSEEVVFPPIVLKNKSKEQGDELSKKRKSIDITSTIVSTLPPARSTDDSPGAGPKPDEMVSRTQPKLAPEPKKLDRSI